MISIRHNDIRLNNYRCRGVPGKRSRPRRASTKANMQNGFFAPESFWLWRDEEDDPKMHAYDYDIFEDEPGDGHFHALTQRDIRDRLSQLPPHLVWPLETVRLCTMTRKRKITSVYGLENGEGEIWLFPIPTTLEEDMGILPPSVRDKWEVSQFGGRFEQRDENWWLVWTPESVRNWYLHNVLIHELGHSNDMRNTKVADREAYAEWFAIEYGYKRSPLYRKRPVYRRHHRKSYA